MDTGAHRHKKKDDLLIGALDVRNQCSGFVYTLSIGNQFIKTGMYKNTLVVGSEKHSLEWITAPVAEMCL